jgi:hypothetical protein
MTTDTARPSPPRRLPLFLSLAAHLAGLTIALAPLAPRVISCPGPGLAWLAPPPPPYVAPNDLDLEFRANRAASGDSAVRSRDWGDDTVSLDAPPHPFTPMLLNATLHGSDLLSGFDLPPDVKFGIPRMIGGSGDLDAWARWFPFGTPPTSAASRAERRRLTTRPAAPARQR